MNKKSNITIDLFIALRYLRGKKRNRLLSAISFISVLGIAVGVMALIIIISVMNGFENDLREKTLSAKPHIMIENSEGEFIEDSKEIIEKIKGMGVVKDIFPTIRAQALVMNSVGVSGVELVGLDFSDENALERIEKLIENKSEKERNLPQSEGIYIGKELAKHLGITKGERIKILLPDGVQTPFGYFPTVRTFKTIGIFSSGIYQFDSTAVFISLDSAKGLLSTKYDATSIDIYIDDIFEADKIAELLKPLAKGLKIRTWSEMNKHLFAALRLEKVAMFSILLLIVLVAVFNITNTLIMTVIEKRGDIAILKSLGATGKKIMRIFMLEGLITGMIGTMSGAFIGLLLCYLLEKYEIVKLDDTVFYTSHIPVDIDFLTVFLIVASSIILSYLSTIYPAKYASKLKPAEVLRFE
ncbi:MAG: lipoprotein-releasing ABC transporter permease subunit [Candidatus Schekmanbacteria bacterium]|nr:MAG: lipoprotein-releasing ABC transporter permease subunit [Candidatus Schekmanbacteria bacterium]